MKRCSIAVVLLLACAFVASAEELLGPAEYIGIITKSKQHYNINSKPSATPADELTCPRRDAGTRVVVDGGKKSLVAWTVKPEAVNLINDAEPLFQAEKYDAAAEKYKQAIALDPQAVAAYFSYGDTLLFSGNAQAALEQYQKGIALDPTLPIGHFFSSTAYVHLGDKANARESIIKALTLYPGYEAVWKIAEQNPEYWGIRPIERHPFEPPAGYLGAKTKNGVDFYGGEDNQWLMYAICKAVWANEKQFAKQHPADGSWTTDEERACIGAQLIGAYNAASKDGKSEAEIVAAMPALEKYIWEVANAKMLDGYVLFERIGRKCPLGLSMLDDESNKRIEAYVRKYIIVAAE